MCRKILLVILFLIAVNAYGGSTINNVTINTIGYDQNFPDVVFIGTSQAPTTQDRVACHTDTNWNYVLKLSTALQEKMYAALLAAQASGQNLVMKGSGLCDPSYPQIESLHIMYIRNP